MGGKHTLPQSALLRVPVDTPTHSPSAWGILPSQRWIQILDLGLQETPLKEAESQQQETMQTSVLGHKTKGCSALLERLALAVSIQPGKARTLQMCLGMGHVLKEIRKQPWNFFNRKRTQSTSQRGTHHVKDGWDTSPELCQLCRMG